MTWSPPKINKGLAKAIARAVDKHWSVHVNGLDDIRSAIAKGILSGMSLAEHIDSQTAVRDWAASLSKKELVQVFRMVEEAKYSRSKMQYRKKDEVVNRWSSELVRIAKSLMGASIPNMRKFVDKLVVEDYPYGRETTEATFEVEGSPGKMRVCRMTIDPKTGRRNKPKCTTYGVSAKIGVGSDGRTYPIVGRPGQIAVWSWDMKHDMGSAFAKDPEYNELAEALGFRTVPGRVTVKETPFGAVIDGLQGRKTTLREIMNLAGLPNEVIDEQVKGVRRSPGKGSESWMDIFTVAFKDGRDDLVIKVYT